MFLRNFSEDANLSKPKKFLLFSIGFILCFFTVTIFRQSFHSANIEVNIWAASVNSGFFLPIARVISFIFDTNMLFLASAGVAVVAFISRNVKIGFLLPSSMAGTALLVNISKNLVASPRPENEIIAQTGFSFPSGHVTASIVFFGILTYFAWQHWNSLKTKAPTAGLYVGVVALVGFDRIYVNVHWLSDVIGAAFFGAFWLAFSLAAFCFLESRSGALRLKLTGKT